MKQFDPQNMALSHSRLCDLANSPAYFKYCITAEQEQTDAMLLGSLVGCLLLEKHKYEERYVLLEKGFDLRSKERKELYQSIITEGKQPIKFDMMESAIAMKNALLANETASQVLRMEYEGINEMRLEWIDKRTGLKMKGFIDRYVKQKDLVIDIKTGADASPFKFIRKFFDYDYDQQGAIYFDGLIAMGHTPQRVAYIAVESEPPYDVGVFNVPADVLLHGRKKYEGRLDFFLQCRDNNLWDKSYDVFSASGIHEIVLPKWLR